VDRLNQLFARSQREIQAHAGVGRHRGRPLLHQRSRAAARRVAAVGAEQRRSDQAVREILEAGDIVALRDAGRELWELGTKDSKAASWSVQAIAKMPSEQFQAIASYALRAL
jgi:hypothetical protein